MKQRQLTIADAIEECYYKAPNVPNKLAVKWMGWVSVFVNMSYKERVSFSKSEEKLAIVMAALTADIKELRNYVRKRRKDKESRADSTIASNKQTSRIHSNGTRNTISKEISKRSKVKSKGTFRAKRYS
jgi:hypothetical protein